MSKNETFKSSHSSSIVNLWSKANLIRAIYKWNISNQIIFDFQRKEHKNGNETGIFFHLELVSYNDAKTT